MEIYTVLLSREEPIPVPRLAAPFAEALDRSPIEVTRRLRECPWILLEDVPASRLDRIFEILSEAGISGKAIPEIHMPVLPPVLRVRVAEPIDRGLFLQEAESPAPPLLPWPELRILAAGLVTTDQGERLFADLLALHPIRLRLRVDGSDFRHDYLKERMDSSSRANFRLFLEAVAEYAPGCRLTDRTRALVEGGSSATFRFRSLAAFESHTRWFLQAVEEALAEEAALLAEERAEGEGRAPEE